jgi:F-type H+-transporting ATPase subunit b
MRRLLHLAVALLIPVAAWAAEIEEHADHHGVPWTKLTFSAINFAIFIYILKRTAWPTLRHWAAERRAKVATALAEAERARQEAEALRAEWQRRLDRLDGELENMLAQARVDIQAERDQILANARRTAETIQRDAARTAESEIRNAQQALRAEVAAQALAVAERLAAERLTDADQQRFVNEFVQQVERR